MTLTYNDICVPCLDDALTLWRDDLTLFFKRLRKALGCKIKYFAVGEYGSVTERPHYHIVLFGWRPDIKELIPLPGGYHTHEKLSALWSLGFVQVGGITNDSIYYTSGYLLKSFLNKDNLGTRYPPFLRVSKGLGLDYAIAHKDRVYNMSLTAEGKTTPLPRYYLKKLGAVDQTKLVTSSYMRQLAVLRKVLAKRTDIPPDLRLQAEAFVKRARIQNEKDIAKLKERLRSKRNKV